MPELPEVETTTKGLRGAIVGLKIKDVWTDYNSSYFHGSDTIKDPAYFIHFKKITKNTKIKSVTRRAKNILINLSNGYTILVHMKMTGHFLYGKYKKDPINRFIHFTITFTNGEKLYFSDMRKFGKITMVNTKTAHDSKHLNNIGPEPLEKKFTFDIFKKQISKKPNGKIKTVLMDQSVIAGIGNIYSDEILWRAGVNPERKVSTLLRQGYEGRASKELELIFKAIKETLTKGIDFGGDSTSDYRNIEGLPGKFQMHHKAYRRTGEKCRKKGCKGTIIRKIINGRSAHFCSVHQK